MPFYKDGQLLELFNQGRKLTEQELFNQSYLLKKGEILPFLNGMRLFAKLTVKELAEKLEVEENFITRLEEGQEEITHRVLEQYAYYCGIDIERRFKIDEGEDYSYPRGFKGKRNLVADMSKTEPTSFDLERIGYSTIDYRKLAVEFKKAADLYIEELSFSKSGYTSDTEFFPIAYMYRHSLELILKHLVISASSETVDEKYRLSDVDIEGKYSVQDILNGHNLCKLGYLAKKALKRKWPDATEEDLKDLEGLHQFIGLLHDMDNSGQDFRYPFKIGDVSSSSYKDAQNIKILDGRKLKKEFNRAFSMVENCSFCF